MSTKDMRVGRIGEYRELSLEEVRTKFAQLARHMQTLELQEKKKVKSIAGMFAEALGSLEDTIWLLERIDERYDDIHPKDECEYPELNFWFGLDDAIEPLKNILRELQSVEKDVPKGAEPVKEGA